MSSPPCHDDPELAAALYVLGSLSADEREALEAHLDECASCRVQVGRLQGAAARTSQTRHVASPNPW